MIAAVRHIARLAGGHWPVGDVWADRRLRLPDHVPGVEWRDLLTGRSLPVADDGGVALRDVYAVLPVAWLERIS